MQHSRFAPRTLFAGEMGEAHVAGLPSGFDLAKELQEARSVWLATAYARMSGWRLIEKPLLAGNATLHLLAGTDHHLTQPELLRTWKALSKPGKIEARAFTERDTTFHAKVLLVATGDNRHFAIVGSANLTEGGLLNDIECSLFTESPGDVQEISGWFLHAFRRANPIDDDLLRDYAEQYHMAQADQRHERKAFQKLRKRQARRRARTIKSELKGTANLALGFFLVNTNVRNSEEDHRRMMQEQEASAFNEPWKYEIDAIHEADIVFLYKSREGIVAFGRAGKLEVRDDEDAHTVPLKGFRLVHPPITASRIRELAGWPPSGWPLRETVEHLEPALGRRIHKIALGSRA